MKIWEDIDLDWRGKKMMLTLLQHGNFQLLICQEREENCQYDNFYWDIKVNGWKTFVKKVHN